MFGDFWGLTQVMSYGDDWRGLGLYFHYFEEAQSHHESEDIDDGELVEAGI